MCREHNLWISVHLQLGNVVWTGPARDCCLVFVGLLVMHGSADLGGLHTETLKRHAAHDRDWVWSSHSPLGGSSMLCLPVHEISSKHIVLRLVCLCAQVDALKPLTGRPSAAL